MKKRTLLILSSLIGAASVAVVLLSLQGHSRADGSTWIGSTIVASGESVEVGQPVSFTVLVVNNMASTASNVLILSPIPENTRFITVAAQDAQEMILFESAPGASEYDQVASAMRAAGLSETTGLDRQASPDISPEDVAAVAWVGDVTGTFAFTLTLQADGGHHITETASIYYEGHLDIVLTGVVDVTWLEVHIPLVLANYAPVANWWEGYPLCPGEGIDREGFGEPGGNDEWHTYLGPVIPIPYQCVGWIHWARGYYDPGEISDQDHFYFVPNHLQADVVATLTRLPTDYQFVAYVPHAPGIQPETLISSNLGTEDEMITIHPTTVATHTLIVYSQLLAGGAVDYDPVVPYLLTVTQGGAGQ
jgi:uncharacterized repeat protein (TIGR01451 family)